MATNTFQCTVCKRQVERVENLHGLDVFTKCIITGGCRGKMKRVGRNLDNIRESFPKFESNLSDYTPRNSFFQHKQAIASKSWLVEHRLNCDPSATVYVVGVDGKYETLTNSQYEIRVIDGSTVRVVFPDAVSGIVHLSTRSSTTHVTPSTAKRGDVTQVTVGGSFVFGIPKYITKTSYGQPTTFDLNDAVGDIRVEVVLEKPNQEPMWCFEKISGMADVTPWSGISEILLAKRKNFYLRSKNILKFATFGDPDVTFNDIPEGTRLRFVSVDYGTGVSQAIEHKSLLLLLSASPYAFTDKIRNKLLDIGEMISTGAFLTYSKGEFFVDSGVVEKTYPPIEVARIVGPTPPMPSPTPTPTVTPTITVSPTITVTPSVTPTISITPTISLTPTIPLTPSITESVTPTPTESVTPTPTESVTPSASETPTPTPTESVTPTPTISVTPTSTVTPTPVVSTSPLPNYGQGVYDKLVAWWEFEENDASARYTDSHGSHQLSLSAPSSSFSDINSKTGTRAAKIPSYGNYMYIPRSNTAFDAADGRISFAGWIRLDGVNADRYPHILGRATGSRSVVDYLLFSSGPTNISSSRGAGASITNNQWHFFHMWEDPTSGNGGFAVDNIISSTGAPIALTNTSTLNLSMGAEVENNTLAYDYGGYSHGLISYDSIVAFSAPLTADEMDWLYNAGVGRTYAEVAVFAP